MGATTKTLGEIDYVTDTDTGDYKVGEVSGGFSKIELMNYIKTYGHEGLCAQLGFMQHQIFEAVNEISRIENNNTYDQLA